MVQQLAKFFSSHRIAVSRVFAIAFFGVVLASEAAYERSLISTGLFLLGLVLVGIATVGRLWCSVYISGHKDAQLITTGPYSISRNPLYFFSMLGFAGIGFATETFTLGVALTVLFLVGYPSVIRREEETLRSKFGREFDAYCARTPRFVPDFSRLSEPDRVLVDPRLFRRTMGDVVWFVWLVGIIELVEALHELHFVEPLFTLP